MRVLTVGNMYPPHHLGGYELAWHSWVTEARERGHEVDVLTTTHREAQPDPGIAEDPSVARELPWYWHEHRFPSLGASEVLRLEREAQRVLSGHLAAGGPEVVCWWAIGGLSLSLIEAVRRRGIPSVFVVMDDWCVYGPKVDRWQRAMDRPLARRLGERLGVPVGFGPDPGDHWLFLSAFLKKRVREAGVEPVHSEVAGRGPDPVAFPPAEPYDWRGELVCIGRLEARKGQQVAVAALAELPDCRLRLVGGGDPGFRDELVALAANLGVSDRLELAEVERGRIAEAYAEADVVLFPVQWEEPWGFVPLEAMAVGRPVVASGSGGSAEYLRDGENALIYEPRDAAGALAGAVRRLAADPGLRRRLRAGGEATAARYSERAFNDAVSAAVEAAGR